MSPVAEAKRITDLYVLLGEDCSLLAEFERDPRALLEESGLDDRAVALVLAGDLATVESAVVTELERDPLRRHLANMPRAGLQIEKVRRVFKLKPQKKEVPPPNQPPGQNPPPPPNVDEPGEGKRF